jgi:hypothetical protein
VNANQRVGNYWFRVKGLGGCAGLEVSETAILNYNGQNLPSALARDELDYQNLIVRGKVKQKYLFTGPRRFLIILQIKT